MKIVVLAGGLSPERDVSLCSGSLIANALIQNGHSVALVDLYKGASSGIDFSSMFYDKDSGRIFSYKVPDTEPDLEALKLEVGRGDALIGENVLDLCAYADITFVALHGSIGENGQLQATFDCFGIKYTGTGYIGSLLAMDKDISKKIMVSHGLPTADWVLVDTKTDSLDDAVEEIGYPCVIKPCSCGSSVGVSIIRDASELKKALACAQKYEDLLMVEKLIEGREFSVGILGGKALPVIEIVPKKGFYDYANKYQPDLTTEICPACLDEDITARMRETAEQIHKALRLGFYSRIDFMLATKGEYFCLEANTLPGMTPTSLLPQEANAAGISYNQLCEMIVEA